MGKFWQRNYYEHIIRNENAYHTISNYIINNPAKWNSDKFKQNVNPTSPNQNGIDSSKITNYNPKIFPDYSIFGISNFLYKVELVFIEDKGNYVEFRIKQRIENRKKRIEKRGQRIEYGG